MADDLSETFHREMLRIHHPGWSHADLEKYIAWEAAIRPRLRDWVKRLWRTARSGEYRDERLHRRQRDAGW